VVPKSGVVRIEKPGQHRFHRIRKPQLVPVGTVFDLRDGRAAIVTRCPRFTG